jgi:hypothetical protein
VPLSRPSFVLLTVFSANISPAHRLQILSTLKQVHALGVKHGDFAERNVVHRPQSQISRLFYLHSGCVLIDFSHAGMNHHCKGPGCEELSRAMKQLGLERGNIDAQPYFEPLPISRILATAAVLAFILVGYGQGHYWRRLGLFSIPGTPSASITWK